MAEWHLKSDRRKSGGLRRSKRRCDKKLAWKGGFAANTTVSKKEKVKVAGERTIGGGRKNKAQEVIYANVSDKKQKKNFKAKVITVKENPANAEFVRRNVITKGAVIKVSVEGKEALAKVTSRPGQHGTVNAVLAE